MTFFQKKLEKNILVKEKKMASQKNFFIIITIAVIVLILGVGVGLGVVYGSPPNEKENLADQKPETESTSSKLVTALPNVLFLSGGKMSYKKILSKLDENELIVCLVRTSGKVGLGFNIEKHPASSLPVPPELTKLKAEVLDASGDIVKTVNLDLVTTPEQLVPASFSIASNRGYSGYKLEDAKKLRPEVILAMNLHSMEVGPGVMLRIRIYNDGIRKGTTLFVSLLDEEKKYTMSKLQNAFPELRGESPRRY